MNGIINATFVIALCMGMGMGEILHTYLTSVGIKMMILFAYFVVFRIMGSDYDAAVIS